MTQRFVLRDLPGVAELEVLCESVPDRPWSPEKDAAAVMAARVSVGLFGITQADTAYEYETEGQAADGWDRWESHFAFIHDEDEDARTLIWEAAGWDITDGDDYELECIHWLGRQIICAVKGLKGHLPGGPIDDAEAEKQAAAWGASLEADAARFARGHRAGQAASRERRNG